MPFSTQRVEELRGECELWREIGQKDNPDFENSWVNYDTGTHALAAFYKDKFNRVWIKGLIKNGTVGLGNAVFTLPEGYRPSERVNYSGIDGTGVPASRIQVYTTGELVVLVGNNGFISLDGFSWRV